MCSAHPTVLQAAITQAAADGGYVLIEATSNQVDQFGGYTGMRPAEFRDLVLGIADDADSRGTASCSAATTSVPTAGSAKRPSAAMENAEVLIAAYVEAGYTKIHLDCSM